MLVPYFAIFAMFLEQLEGPKLLKTDRKIDIRVDHHECPKVYSAVDVA